ncbi:hypothetical protein D3C77_428100 [compost metagenome]
MNRGITSTVICLATFKLSRNFSYCLSYLEIHHGAKKGMQDNHLHHFNVIILYPHMMRSGKPNWRHRSGKVMEYLLVLLIR